MKQPFGQNFLVEKNIAQRIVDAAGITSADKVIEIGPGKGILTTLIAPVAKEFKAIEVDRVLSEDLKTRFSGFTNTEIIFADFMKYPFSAETGPLKLISNLPYNVSTAILEIILPEKCWTTSVIMVQKEVGERLTAKSGTKQYGSFTIICGYYARFEKLFFVGPGCFSPKPKVDSVVLMVKNLLREPLENKFTNFIRAAFSQRRKMALNSLSLSLDIPKATVLAAFERSSISPALRPENLDIEQYKALYKNLLL
jgi:16S rRNA (adenine1518-N6/adenine1519-N6)-dimethyltransferase